MKLASLRHGRDGRLVVVSDDLAWYAHSGPEVPTMQAALDDWTHAEPRLRAVAEGVNNGTILRERFHEREAASPLPRASRASSPLASSQSRSTSRAAAACSRRIRASPSWRKSSIR